jgi:hypothetical protein
LVPFKWQPSGHGILSEWVYQWVGSQDLLSHLIAIFLLLIQGFSINLLCINHRLSNEVTLFPGLFYILVSCAIPDFLYLSPVLMGNTFFLIALFNLFETYKNPACADSIFNTGWWIGIASLFYFPFIFYFVVAVVGLNILRAFNIRERLMNFLGLLTPYILVGIYSFWFDHLGKFLEIQFSRNADFLSFTKVNYGWDFYLKIGSFAVLLLFIIVNNDRYLIKKNIQVQKKIGILLWILPVAGISAIFQNNLTLEHLLMLAPSLGIFLAFTFAAISNRWAESLHLILLVGVLALQFSPMLI